MTNKPNCARHKTTLDAFGKTSLQVATELGDLRYNDLQEILQLLSEKLKEDSEKDMMGGRIQLSNELLISSQILEYIPWHIARAWEICKPYMDENTK